jgi:aspartyl/asparaginyl beta-hydroxylase (cupin superfamily)
MNTGWLNSSEYYFNRIIEQHVDIIRSEFLSIMQNRLLIPYAHTKTENDIVVVIKTGWSGFLLKDKNKWIEKNCEHAPETSRLLKSFFELENQPKGTFGFSVVHKNTIISPHTNKIGEGIRHRHQLCIDPIIELNKEDIYLKVNGVVRTWNYGTVISFDDGYTHTVTNNTEHDRAVLIYDSIPLNKFRY